MANLSKEGFNHKRLQPGDPYTVLDVSDDGLKVLHELQQAGRPFSRWFDTGERGRLFRIAHIHDAQRSVESVYLGFQLAPGSDEVAAE